MNPTANSHFATRRQLLARTGVLGAGLLSRFNILSADTKPDSLLRVGLIGCGGRGSGAADQTLSVYGSNVKLVAMGDAFDHRLKQSLQGLSGKHADKVDVPAERQFVGPDAYAKVFEHCDFVILATPPGFRPFHFEAAIKAGKHVFMEKPVCVDSFGALKVLEVAKEADAKNLKVVVGLQRHYQNSYRETIKRLQDGMIGDIISANVYWNGGAIWYRDKMDGMNEMQFQVHNWYHFAWLSGDHICEQHVHNLDVANWFIGATPESAQGLGGRQVRNPEHPTEIFDHHAVEFRYPNGVVVNSQCRQITGCANNVSETFYGTKGILKVGNITDYKGNVLWRNRDKGDPNPYQVEHDELHDAIRNNKPLNNAVYGATSSFTACLGRYATYTGKEVKWADALKANIRTMPENFSWDAKAPVQPDEKGAYALPMPGTWKMA
jgi:myo-inositol 2-dehydrogenase / D-chiro-inositol 1-dehydrogenase